MEFTAVCRFQFDIGKEYFIASENVTEISQTIQSLRALIHFKLGDYQTVQIERSCFRSCNIFFNSATRRSSPDAASVPKTAAAILWGNAGKNRLELAHDGREESYPLLKHPVYSGLDGVIVLKVHDPNLWVLLSDAINSSDSLFNPHRVPRQVIVDERPTELEVQAFGGGVGA